MTWARTPRAARYARSALDVSRQCRDRRGEGLAHLVIGAVHQHLREYREAAAAYRESLAIARETGGTSSETVALVGLAMTDLATGEPHAAVERAHDAYAHVIAGRALSSTGDEPAAEDHARRARALFTAIGAPEAAHTRLALGRG